MHVGIVVGNFPALSETFVANHIRAVLERGLTVTVIVRGRLHAGRGAEFAAPEHADRLRFCVLGGGSTAAKIAATLLATGAALVTQPARLARALNLDRLGRGGLTGAYLRQLRAVERAGPFELLHCHFGTHGVFAAHLAHLGLRCPVLTTFHGFDVNAVTPELRASYEYLFAEGAAFTANTNYTAQRAIAFGCPSARLHLWPQGTRVREFPFAERTPPIGRPARVLSVGRLVPKKGFDTLLTAFARVRARGYDAELHIVGGGGGPHAERLRRLPAELGIADRVQFHGAQPPARVRDFMAAADVFVLASKTAPNGDKEGQALALQEAQACGLPVLSTLHNGIPEGVADGASGVLVPENDADALAGALIELLSQPQRWAAMGRAGRRFVEEHYELDRVTDQLMAIYAGLSGGPPDGRA